MLFRSSESEKKAVVNDEDGQPLSSTALEHYHLNRFRCRNCDTIFCTGCKKIPYHLGYTCDSWDAFQKSDRHCVICNKAVPPTAKPYVQGGDNNEPEEEAEEPAEDEGKGKEKVKVNTAP